MTHHAPHQHDHPHSPHEADDFAELIDLDAEVLHEQLAQLTGWLEDALDGGPARRILDLGAGSGTGTMALARRFDAAEVIAVDASADLLDRAHAKASAAGIASRVRTVLADLDETWPDLDAVDAAWASLSMHHFADPDAVLAHVHDVLRPGGAFAVVEMETPPRFLPHELGIGRPGLEERCHAALRQETEQALPHLGSEWGPRLERAGFGAVEQRSVSFDLHAPHAGPVGRYARAFLARLRAGIDSADTAGLDAEDLAVLDLLLGDGPDSLLHRDDLTVVGTRPVWLARRG